MCVVQKQMRYELLYEVPHYNSQGVLPLRYDAEIFDFVLPSSNTHDVTARTLSGLCW